MTMAAGSGDYTKVDEYKNFFEQQFEALQLKDLPLTATPSSKPGGDKNGRQLPASGASKRNRPTA